MRNAQPRCFEVSNLRAGTDVMEPHIVEYGKSYQPVAGFARGWNTTENDADSTEAPHKEVDLPVRRNDYASNASITRSALDMSFINVIHRWCNNNPLISRLSINPGSNA